MTWFAISALTVLVVGLSVVCVALALGQDQQDELIDSIRERLLQVEQKLGPIEARLAEMEEDL